MADELRALLGKYMIRRVKDDVADLRIPEKSVVNVYHGLSKVQTDLYRAILSRNHGRAYSSFTCQQLDLFQNPFRTLRPPAARVRRINSR